MRARLTNATLQLAQLITIGALLYLYFRGSRIAIEAIRALADGKETDPLDVPYPAWTIVHFASALIFAVLVIPRIASRILLPRRAVASSEVLPTTRQDPRKVSQGRAIAIDSIYEYAQPVCGAGQ